MSPLISRGRSLAFPLLIIGLGVVFLLDQMRVFTAAYLFSYFWPAIFCFFGLELLLSHGRNKSWLGACFLLVGGALIAQRMGRLPVEFYHWWPLGIIALGVMLLIRGGGTPWMGPIGGFCRPWTGTYGAGGWRGMRGMRQGPGGGAQAGAPTPAGFNIDTPQLDAVAFLGGFKRRVTAQNFRGGKLAAFWGGFNLDLSHAEIEGPSATLEIHCVMGGGEIRVPETWQVDYRGQSVLGGFSDETIHRPPSDGSVPKRLIIVGTFLFGGLAVKS